MSHDLITRLTAKDLQSAGITVDELIALQQKNRIAGCFKEGAEFLLALTQRRLGFFTCGDVVGPDEQAPWLAIGARKRLVTRANPEPRTIPTEDAILY